MAHGTHMPIASSVQKTKFVQQQLLKSTAATQVSPGQWRQEEKQDAVRNRIMACEKRQLDRDQRGVGASPDTVSCPYDPVKVHYKLPIEGQR